MVSCPICGKPLPLSEINDHLDQCEKPKRSQPTLQSLKRKTSEPEVIDLEEPPRKQLLTPMKTTVSVTNREEEDMRIWRQQAHVPLSERLRPQTLDEYIGQTHLLGPEGILTSFIISDSIPSMILWGPPGVGKTTIARLISKNTKQRFVELNASTSGLADLKKVVETTSNERALTKRRTIVFIDEIHRYNKTQQDYLLPFVEKGDIVLIGATTENPSFKLNNALLSRCKVFVLKALTPQEIHIIMNKAILQINRMRKYQGKEFLKMGKECIDYVSKVSQGDSRVGITLLELINTLPQSEITVELIKPLLSKTMLYDRDGELHYDTISAFHKSVRGGDADAAMVYLQTMLSGGEDPLYIARRMIRIASEDVGDDTCLPFAVAAYEAVMKVGLPEADLALAHCAVKLARAVKSVEIYRAWGRVKEKLRDVVVEVPLHLRNAPTNLMRELGYGAGYQYPPNFSNGQVDQEYMPDVLQGVKFLDGKHLG